MVKQKPQVKPQEIPEKEKKPDPVYQFGVDIITNEKGKIEYVDPNANVPAPEEAEDFTSEKKRTREDVELDEFDNTYGIPYSNEVILRGHTKMLSAIGLGIFLFFLVN